LERTREKGEGHWEILGPPNWKVPLAADLKKFIGLDVRKIKKATRELTPAKSVLGIRGKGKRERVAVVGRVKGNSVYGERPKARLNRQ